MGAAGGSAQRCNREGRHPSTQGLQLLVIRLHKSDPGGDREFRTEPQSATFSHRLLFPTLTGHRMLEDMAKMAAVPCGSPRGWLYPGKGLRSPGFGKGG